jgi:hypothetical protein
MSIQSRLLSISNLRGKLLNLNFKIQYYILYKIHCSKKRFITVTILFFHSSSFSHFFLTMFLHLLHFSNLHFLILQEMFYFLLMKKTHGMVTKTALILSLQKCLPPFLLCPSYHHHHPKPS